jgi:hypothetical protein
VIGLLSRGERSLELAIDLDALIAVVSEERSEEERRTTSPGRIRRLLR